MYVSSHISPSTVNMTGKIIVRDYTLLPIPTTLITDTAYYVSQGATDEESYTRPFVSPPGQDFLDASLGGAAGFISAFNVSRDQLESYYSNHAGGVVTVTALH
jgi:hypothetical protein